MNSFLLNCSRDIAQAPPIVLKAILLASWTDSILNSYTNLANWSRKSKSLSNKNWNILQHLNACISLCGNIPMFSCTKTWKKNNWKFVLLIYSWEVERHANVLMSNFLIFFPDSRFIVLRTGNSRQRNIIYYKNTKLHHRKICIFPYFSIIKNESNLYTYTICL